MTTWGDFQHEAPELARRVQARFDDTGLALVATLRADGSPRSAAGSRSSLGASSGSAACPARARAPTLRRDPRLTLHNATVDKDATVGRRHDRGRAVEVTEDDAGAPTRSHFKAATDLAVPIPFDLFRVEPTGCRCSCPVATTW